MNNERKKVRANARSHHPGPRSERSSLPSALSQPVCWVTAFRNPLRKPGNLAQTFLQDRTVQVYIINIPPTPHYFHWRDKKRGGEGDAVVMAVVLITPHSSLAIKLKGDSVWEWKWLSQQKRSSPFISAFISRLGSKAAAACRNLSKFLLWSWINLSKAIRCNWTSQHCQWRWDPGLQRYWAVLISSLNHSLDALAVSACKGHLLVTMKLHKRAGSLTVAFYCRLQLKNEKFSRQMERQSTCRYAQVMSTVAAFIQTLRCDHWLDSCLARFVPFIQSHIYILHLGGPGWVIRMLLFLPPL